MVHKRQSPGVGPRALGSENGLGWQNLRSKASNLLVCFGLFFGKEPSHKGGLTCQEMRELGVALRKLHLEQ